jgi:hypothetical protein
MWGVDERSAVKCSWHGCWSDRRKQSCKRLYSNPLVFFLHPPLQERLVREFENQREQLLHQHSLEKEEMLTRFAANTEELNEEIAAVQKDRDEQLLLAEADKQQVNYVQTTSWVFLMLNGNAAIIR